VCHVHNYLNDFFCLQCHREICSHCLFMATSPHQSHDTVRLKDYLASVLRKSKDFSQMCAVVQRKYERRPSGKVREAVRAKEQALCKLVDKHVDRAVARLREVQQRVKREFSAMLYSNVQQVEGCQDSMLRKAKRGKELCLHLGRAADKAKVRDIVEAAKAIEVAYTELDQ